MAKLSKDEIDREEAAIRAAEQSIQERWCRLRGHRWDLPQPNPLNSDSYTCALLCNRCGVRATLTIEIDVAPAAPAPAAPAKGAK
jgi:hypothetical protein